MGTNFYCKHIPTVKEYEEMERKLQAKQYKELKQYIDKIIPEYHIGKRSGGWQFLFQAHDQNIYQEWEPEAVVPWEATEQSIKKYLQRDDVEIYNEYGEQFTFDQFWNDEIGPYLYRDENHMNVDDYYNKCPSEYRYNDHTQKEIDGLRWDFRWFS